MPVVTYTIDGRGVRSFADFVAAANAGFIERVGGRWNGNLDAFNDYLTWPAEEEYELELLGSETVARSLGHAAQAARLRDRLTRHRPEHSISLQTGLADAEAGVGPTLFDLIKKIVSDNPRVRLTLR